MSEAQTLPACSECESDTTIIVLIKTHKDLEKQVLQVRLSAERSVQGLRMLLANEPEALQVLRFIKFKDIGHHPAGDLKINILEQAQLTFNRRTVARENWPPHSPTHGCSHPHKHFPRPNRQVFGTIRQTLPLAWAASVDVWRISA